jgi:Flp pilus assembly protein TadB
MDARDWRLIKMFAANVAWLLAIMVGMVSWIVVLWWLPQPWSVICGIAAPVLFLVSICWDQAKHRLERQEMLEKKIADQLVNSD